LNSGEWFFLFVIVDRLSHRTIHLNDWSETPRPPLYIMDYAIGLSVVIGFLVLMGIVTSMRSCWSNLPWNR